MSYDLVERPNHRGRVIMITGAGGSLGVVASKALAAAGAQLILLDKSVTKLEQLSDEIVSAGDLMPALYPLDFTDATEADYLTLASIVEAQFGVLHGLLHSAAELGQLQPLTDVSATAWQTLFLVNLTAPFLLTKALLPALNQAERASVIFTTDSSARANKPYWGAYGVAKNAMESLAHIWAEELESAGRIRVNIFAPGPTRSAIRRKSHPGEMIDSLPLPETLADHYIRLLHPDCDATTGTVAETASVSPLNVNRDLHHVRP